MTIFMFKKGVRDFLSIRRGVVFLVILILIVAIEGGVLLSGTELLSGIPKFPQDCLEKPDGYERWDCLNPYFEKLTKATSASIALTEARELTKQGTISDCHIAAHTIGGANLEKHDFDMGQAFASCGFQCIQGCMHGVTERYLQNEADPYKILSEIKNICDSVALPPEVDNRIFTKDNLLWAQCHHGIGHGMLQHGLFSLQDAAQACNSFDDSHAQRRCLGGVMMENVNQYLLADESYLQESLPKVCAGVEKMKEDEATYRVWEMCMTAIPQGLMWYTGHDIERSQQLCEGLLQQSYKALCKKAVISLKETRNDKILVVPF